MATNHFGSMSAYQEFAESILQRRRFIPDSAIAGFIAAVRKTVVDRSFTLKAGMKLCRAQIGCVRNRIPTAHGNGQHVLIERPFGRERMIPDPDKVGDGRANPHGIAYLYAAMDHKTAIAEVRPWVGADVTVAFCTLSADVRLVDCRSGGWPPSGLAMGTDEDGWDDWVWDHIGQAFARPVSPTDSIKTYLPTQVLAEVFQDVGFHGIGYKSALNEDGINIVLFDPSQVGWLHSVWHRVTAVEYTSKQDGQAHYMGDVVVSESENTASVVAIRLTQ